MNFFQSSSIANNATPLLTQYDTSLFVFKSRYITKFVECPVVDKVPFLVEVLYNGQLYPTALYSDIKKGSNLYVCEKNYYHTTGISSNKIYGRDSSREPVKVFHLHPSINIPWILTPIIY